MNLISDWGTKKNTKKFHKSNEDYALADDNNGIYIIVDGVSRDRLKGVYPEPSPSRHVSELFVRQAYECLKQNCLKMNSESIVKQAFESGIYLQADRNLLNFRTFQLFGKYFFGE